MAGIPSEALLTDDDTRAVSYAPWATIFKFLRERPRLDRHAGLLALGNPVYERPGSGVVFDPTPAPEAIAAILAMTQSLARARSDDEEFAPLPGTRYEVEALAQLFKSDDRPSHTLLAADASEDELDRLAASGELGRFGFIHLATHGVIDEAIPQRSAVILTQTGLPDPLEQVLNKKPVYDGRLVVREIQRTWDLNAKLVTLSACETALGRDAGGDGFVGFTQALLMSGARSVCLWSQGPADQSPASTDDRPDASWVGSKHLGELANRSRLLNTAGIVGFRAETAVARPSLLARPVGATTYRPRATPR